MLTPFQSLLREVHTEGMQVLSLSELPCGEGAELGPHLPLQGWTKEREALMATVESLKTLILEVFNKQTGKSNHHHQWSCLFGPVTMCQEMCQKESKIRI